MRYPGSEKLEIIGLVEHSHLPVRRTLATLGILPMTFYRWYARLQAGGPEALEDKPSRPRRVWNRIPEEIREQIVELALDEPELSPREVATRFTDVKKYFVSEASVYRLLKAHDLITSPAYIVVKAADEFKDKTTAPNELWQNGHTERLIGSIRRECLDHVLILGEAHLCQILRAYGDYYNRIRTHLARGCAYHLSHPDIFVMESAEEWDCSGQSFIADC